MKMTMIWGIHTSKLIMIPCDLKFMKCYEEHVIQCTWMKIWLSVQSNWENENNWSHQSSLIMQSFVTFFSTCRHSICNQNNTQYLNLGKNLTKYEFLFWSTNLNNNKTLVSPHQYSVATWRCFQRFWDWWCHTPAWCPWRLCSKRWWWCGISPVLLCPYAQIKMTLMSNKVAIESNPYKEIIIVISFFIY